MKVPSSPFTFHLVHARVYNAPAAGRRDTGRITRRSDTSTRQPRWGICLAVCNQRGDLHGPGQYFRHGPADDACLWSHRSGHGLRFPRSCSATRSARFPAVAWAIAGEHVVLACALVWWSLCTVLTAVVATCRSHVGRHRRAHWSLCVLPGVGESGVLLNFNRAVADWMPPGQRGLGIGIAIGGIGIGAAITPPSPPGSW